MLEQKKAAEYFVVAWCKDWSLGQYMNAVFEGMHYDELGDAVAVATAAYPWMPERFEHYGRPVREFVSRSYPKLNAWLWDRPDDLARLKCAEQVCKLRPRATAGRVAESDRLDMAEASKAMKQSTTSYRASRDAFRTGQRSAWNVCKA